MRNLCTFLIVWFFVAVVPARADVIANSIAVEGEGMVFAKPDYLKFTVGVETLDAKARTAVEQNNKKVDAVISAIQLAGVEKSDMRTSNFEVSPQYYEDGVGKERRDRIVGYKCLNVISVTVKDLELIPIIIDAAMQAGANVVDDIAFDVTDSKVYLDKAMESAIADARHKAEVAAAAGGMRVGLPISIQIDDAEIDYTSSRFVSVTAQKRGPTILESQVPVSVTVTVIYSLTK